MQRCQTCNRTYPDDAPAFCPHDATRLVNDAAANSPAPSVQSSPYGGSPQQYAAPQRTGRRKLPLVLGSFVLLAAIGAGLYFLLRPKPPAGTFPDQVGQYKLKRRPEHHSTTDFGTTPKDSWWSVYERGTGAELVKGQDATIDVQYDVLVFSSPDEAKQVLKSLVDSKIGGNQYYSWQVVQQGNRQNKPGELFMLRDEYFTDKDKGKGPELARNDAIWTDGSMLIIAESSPNDDQRVINSAKAQGLNEPAAVDFMKNYPN